MACKIPLGLISPSATIGAGAGAVGRKFPISKAALRITRGAADGLDHSFKCSVLNPSNRLRLILEIAFESDSGAEYTIANLVWSVTAMSLNPTTGKRTPMQLIYPNTGTTPAPDSYEVDTAVRAARVTVSVPSTVTFGWPASETGGQLWIHAIWEADVAIPPDELAQLLAACQLQVDGQPAATTYL